MNIIKDLAARYSGSQKAYLALNQQLKDKYGTDLDQTLSMTGLIFRIWQEHNVIMTLSATAAI
jgi:hypothetical protein